MLKQIGKTNSGNFEVKVERENLLKNGSETRELLVEGTLNLKL